MVVGQRDNCSQQSVLRKGVTTLSMCESTYQKAEEYTQRWMEQTTLQKQDHGNMAN